MKFRKKEAKFLVHFLAGQNLEAFFFLLLIYIIGQMFMVENVIDVKQE